MNIYLVKFHVCEPIWLIVRAKNKQKCKQYVEKWKRNGNFTNQWKYSIQTCSKEEGIILVEEY